MNPLTLALSSLVLDRPVVVICHRLPQRLRLQVPALRKLDRGAHVAARLESRLACLPGVQLVRASSVTGSILVEHDGGRSREQSIVSTVWEHLPAVEVPPTARLGSYLDDFSDRANRVVLRATDGWLDLTTLVPLALGVFGAGMFLVGKPHRTPAGTLLWWAYSTLIRGHGSRG